MIVLILQRTTPSLRGELTRWLIQPQAGVFVGHVSARVRELLWKRVCAKARDGAAILIYPDSGEQGFTIRSFGDPSRIIEDFEGILLPKKPISA